jgi:predicted amidophosphoribosyltransferase
MSDSRSSLTALRDLLLGVLLPVPCVGCGGGSGPLCVACAPRPAVVWAPPGRWPVPCASAGPYAGVLRAAVLAYKERGVRSLAGPLGALLAAAVRAATGPVRGPVVLVPIPSGSAARRARGDDHMARLARVTARVLRRGGVPATVLPLLTMNRATADSVGLSAAARRANLAGAYGARPGRRPVGRLVLVDDVVTSGATLGEAMRAAEVAGMRLAAAATVAATRLHGVGDTPGSRTGLDVGTARLPGKTPIGLRNPTAMPMMGGDAAHSQELASWPPQVRVTGPRGSRAVQPSVEGRSP